MDNGLSKGIYALEYLLASAVSIVKSSHPIKKDLQRSKVFESVKEAE